MVEIDFASPARRGGLCEIVLNTDLKVLCTLPAYRQAGRYLVLRTLFNALATNPGPRRLPLQSVQEEEWHWTSIQGCFF